jgi:hypothetical protein
VRGQFAISVDQFIRQLICERGFSVSRTLRHTNPTFTNQVTIEPLPAPAPFIEQIK